MRERREAKIQQLGRSVLDCCRGAFDPRPTFAATLRPSTRLCDLKSSPDAAPTALDALHGSWTVLGMLALQVKMQWKIVVVGMYRRWT